MSDVEKVTEAMADAKVTTAVENGSGSCENSAAAAKTNDSSNSSHPSLGEMFKLFSKFGDTKSDGKLITLSQSDKWMKQAKVIDGKKITTTDTGIHFKKLKSLKVPLSDYKKFLEDLAKTKNVDLEEIKKKMVECGAPGTATNVPKGGAGVVSRLTDTSKYTGSHKQRFDETGKGKGIAGRKDLVDTSGYVSGYQHKDSFGKPE